MLMAPIGMDMVRHDHVGIDIKLFVLVAPGKVFNDKVVIYSPGKNVNPIGDR